MFQVGSIDIKGKNLIVYNDNGTLKRRRKGKLVPLSKAERAKMRRKKAVKQEPAADTRSRVRPEPRKRAAPKKAGAKKARKPVDPKRSEAARKAAATRRRNRYRDLRDQGGVSKAMANQRLAQSLGARTPRSARFDLAHTMAPDRVVEGLRDPRYVNWYKNPARWDLRGYDTTPVKTSQLAQYGRYKLAVNPQYVGPDKLFKKASKTREGPTLKQLQAEAKDLGIRLSYARDGKKGKDGKPRHKKGSTKNKATLQREIAKAQK